MTCLHHDIYASVYKSALSDLFVLYHNYESPSHKSLAHRISLVKTRRDGECLDKHMPLCTGPPCRAKSCWSENPEMWSVVPKCLRCNNSVAVQKLFVKKLLRRNTGLAKSSNTVFMSKELRVMQKSCKKLTCRAGGSWSVHLKIGNTV